jgi:hypothetical protein
MAVGVEVVAGMAGAEEAVDFTAGAVVVAGMAEAAGLLGFTVGAVAVVAGMAEAVGTMDLLPMVAGPTWVMGRVVTAFRLAACMHTDQLLTA